MQRSESIKEIAAALAKAQGQMANASKDAKNAHFNSKYATLASIVDAIKKPFSDNGLSYYQDTTFGAEHNELSIETLLMHTSGEWILSDPLVVPVMKHDAQGVASAMTYGRRIGLSAATGVAPDDDDDGNAAANAAPPRQEVKAKSVPPKEPPKAEPPKVDQETGEILTPSPGPNGKETVDPQQQKPAPPGMLGLIRGKAKAAGISEATILAKHELEKLEGIGVTLGNFILTGIAKGEYK